MTVEEAKQFFGDFKIIPYLSVFNEGNIRKRIDKISKLKTGYTYYYNVNKYDKWIVNLLGTNIIGTYIRFKCVYRRSGVAFIKFADYSDIKHEEPVYDGSDFAKYCCPEILSAKEYKYNHDLSFVIDDLNGLIKIVE